MRRRPVPARCASTRSRTKRTTAMMRAIRPRFVRRTRRSSLSSAGMAGNVSARIARSSQAEDFRSQPRPKATAFVAASTAKIDQIAQSAMPSPGTQLGLSMLRFVSTTGIRASADTVAATSVAGSNASAASLRLFQGRRMILHTAVRRGFPPVRSAKTCSTWMCPHA